MAKAKKPKVKPPMMKGKGAKAPMPPVKGKKKNPFGHEGK
jgi:hypothetical protein